MRLIFDIHDAGGRHTEVPQPHAQEQWHHLGIARHLTTETNVQTLCQRATNEISHQRQKGWLAIVIQVADVSITPITGEEILSQIVATDRNKLDIRPDLVHQIQSRGDLNHDAQMPLPDGMTLRL
ncbi:hypothetical protein D3C77_407550 [compost metagenome]